MNKTPTSSLTSQLKKTAALVVISIFTAGIGYHFTRSLPPRNIKPETARPADDLENIGNGWWESKRLIYHGIPARIVFVLPPATDIRQDTVNEALWHEFDRIGKIFNPFDPDSEIFYLNSTTQSNPILISDDMKSVVHISQQLWIDTNGQFEPTMWPIKQLWQNAEKIQQVPNETDIAKALQKTGFDQVRFIENNENSIQFVNHPLKFDFGGVVKGYAVDRIRQILVNSGITAGLVQLGGEISAFGYNDKKPWRIGVQHPKQMDRIWGIISAYGDIRVSTSGNYRQPIKINGKSYYHIFSPKNGKPVSEKVLGVTTACINGKNTNARLDGIATAITVMGPAKGFELAKKLKVEAVILYKKNDGAIGELMTPGLPKHYTPAEK